MEESPSPTPPQTRWMYWLAALAAVLVVAMQGVTLYHTWPQAQDPPTGQGLVPGDTHHAILLSNQSAYFGRIAEVGPDYLLLKQVFYIQTRVTEDQQTVNTLVKRGGEWHGPDSMRVNLDHVLFIEPVGEDSEVARLIAERTGS